MRSWLTALRIARREARRARGRSALVVAMIAVPVLALSLAAASYDMFRLTPAEQATRLLGGADAKIDWVGTEPVEQHPTGIGPDTDASPHNATVSARDLLAVLPPGSAVTPLRRGSLALRTGSGVGDLAAYGLDVAAPMMAGIVTLREGRAPAGAGELALTAPAADRLAAGLGGTVHNADRTTSWTVTGIVEFPGDLGEQVVFPPEHVLDSTQWFWDAPGPVDWAAVQRLNQRGMVVISRAVLLDPPVLDPADPRHRESENDVSARTFAVGGLVVGLGVLEVMLLAGPAFAVGARRRQRDLALITANGGTPAHLRRIVLADGLVLGALGAVPGILLGAGAAVALRPLIEVHLAQQRAGGYRVFPLALAAIAGLAVGTGLLAALAPAVTAARGDVVAALTGRRGVRRSRRRWLVLGLAFVAAGAATAGYGAWRIASPVILAGLVAAELGLVLCTPALVGLVARLGPALPLAPRIALRDTARNRAAAVPAVAAVMAAVAGSVALGVVRTAEQDRAADGYRPGLPIGHAIVTYDPVAAPPGLRREPPEPVTMDQVAAAVRASLPVADIVPVSHVTCPAGEAHRAACQLRPQLPPDRRCPYAADTGPALSRAEQRAANDDPRCAISNARGAVMLDALIAGPAAVPALTEATGADLARARATLAAGGALVDDARYLVDGKVTLQVHKADQDGTMRPEARTLTVPGYAPSTGTPLSTSVYAPELVEAARLGARPNAILVATDRMPTPAEQDRLAAALRDLDDEALSAMIERRPATPRDPTLLILAAVAGLITLGAAGIATGLAAADSRGDLATLSAVGASPGVRRKLSLSQSGMIAGLGTALGLLAGLGASTAVLFAYNRTLLHHWPREPTYPIGVPWQTVAVVLVVPLVAMLGTGLLTRSRLPIERRARS